MEGFSSTSKQGRKQKLEGQLFRVAVMPMLSLDPSTACREAGGKSFAASCSSHVRFPRMGGCGRMEGFSSTSKQGRKQKLEGQLFRVAVMPMLSLDS